MLLASQMCFHLLSTIEELIARVAPERPERRLEDEAVLFLLRPVIGEVRVERLSRLSRTVSTVFWTSWAFTYYREGAAMALVDYVESACTYHVAEEMIGERCQASRPSTASRTGSGSFDDDDSATGISAQIVGKAGGSSLDDVAACISAREIVRDGLSAEAPFQVFDLWKDGIVGRAADFITEIVGPSAVEAARSRGLVVQEEEIVCGDRPPAVVRLMA